MSSVAEVIDNDRTSIVRAAIADVEERLAGDVARVLEAARQSEEDKVSEALDDAVADMKSYFGSTEANRVSDAEAESAIATVETWITDNVSNGTLEERITGALTMKGASDLIASFG